MKDIKEKTANETCISENDIKELKNLSMKKKSKMRFRTFESFINGNYKVKIGGMGNKSIKCEIYLDYESILAKKSKDGLEKMIYNKLMVIGEPE